MFFWSCQICSIFASSVYEFRSTCALTSLSAGLAGDVEVTGGGASSNDCTDFISAASRSPGYNKKRCFYQQLHVKDGPEGKENQQKAAFRMIFNEIY